jgi:N-acetylneuraminic acid mutarotase
MPDALVNASATRGPDGRIYVMGGSDDFGNSPPTVYAYDPGTNNWTTEPPLPTQLTWGAAATIGKTLYTVGGDDGTYDEGSTRVSTYSPGDPSWSSGPSLPSFRIELAAATGPDQRLYALGCGYAGANSMEILDPVQGSWTQVSMPTPRGFLAAATGTDGRIYAIGGFDPTAVGDPALTSVDAYDVGSRQWATVAPMNVPRATFAAATDLKGRVYAIAGINGTAALNSVEAYDPATDRWTMVAPMDQPRQGHVAVTGLDGRIYVFGGNINNHGSASTEVYDPTLDVWSE